MGINNSTEAEWDALSRITTTYPAVDEYHKAIADQNKSSTKQVGGDHYKKFKIQPAEFCYKNNIPYLESTAIKYLCRWKDKGGIQDLDKAIHFIELLKEFYNGD